MFGNKEVSLKDAMRNNCSEDDLTTLIAAAVKRKQKQHAGKNYLRDSQKMWEDDRK